MAFIHDYLEIEMIQNGWKLTEKPYIPGDMGESSKFPKSWTLENQNLKRAVCLQNIKNSKFNGQILLDELKLNQKSYYYLQNSAFWGWLSMGSQP